MERKRIAYLYQQYLDDNLTPFEVSEWEELLLNLGSNPFLQEIAHQTWQDLDKQELVSLRANRSNQILEQILNHSKRKVFKLWQRISVAVSIVICLGIGLYFYAHKTHNSENHISYDIAPGGNKAYLTLADGKRITLTNAKNGELAEQSGIKITKAADGQLIYSVSNLDDGRNKTIAYNTIATPNGGQYQVILPDGTKVWLNAVSSLRYPSSFSNLANRKVELLYGEAYFEVAKDKKHPFIVQSDKQEVKVLGTHFNINSYADEDAVKTTLLEGRVEVSKAGVGKILKPGEQSINYGSSINIQKVDVETALDWKNGMLIFNGEKLESIMRKVSRWYNVDVVYEDDELRKQPFEGKVSRFVNVSDVLEVLELTGFAHFNLEGRKITIKK